MANGGIQTFTVVGMAQIHGTPFSVASVALSGFLLFSAGGVLLGGIIADRTKDRLGASDMAVVAMRRTLMEGATQCAASGQPHPAAAKAWLITEGFMELRRAPRLWRRLMLAWALLLAALIFLTLAA